MSVEITQQQKTAAVYEALGEELDRRAVEKAQMAAALKRQVLAMLPAGGEPVEMAAVRAAVEPAARPTLPDVLAELAREGHLKVEKDFGYCAVSRAR